MTIEKSVLRDTMALAKLELDDSKEAEMIAEMQKIIAFVETLDQLDVTGVKPTYNGNDLHTMLREDKAIKSDAPKKLLENAPDRKDNFIQVPALMDKEGGDA